MNLNAIYELPPTVRMYNAQPYLSEAEATVLYVEDNIAVFDRTIFYAESGGQLYDIGTINGEAVVDVQKKLGVLHSVKNDEISVPSVKINTRIIHQFSNPVGFNIGDVVTMKIDWNRRYKIMQHHTLSHFLFYGIESYFKKNNVDLFLKGCLIDETRGGFSLNNSISDEQLLDIKQIINNAFEPDQEIAMIAEETNDEVYYWTFKDIIIPCGGTHVKNTTEIAGDFIISKKSGGKNKTKIYIRLS